MVEMGEERLKQKEWIDRENRLNQGGHVLVEGANGEGKEELRPQWLYGKHAWPSDYCISLVAITGPLHMY